MSVFGDDVSRLDLELHVDDRGTLAAVDLAALPFAVQRMFVVTGVPAGTRRGGHSHRRGAQALFCLGGRIEVELRRDDRVEVDVLAPDGRGLLIRAGVWSEQRYVVEGSELLVLASEPFDPGTYERRHRER
jgi:dTDP-4-dehydrorhamnose 3,5-epimerase-like enzyme